MSDADFPDGERRRDGSADAPVVHVAQIVNKKGLHARASAKFVRTAEEFNAQVRVTRSGETVGGTSIMGLMMLAASTGTKITIEATGPEAAAAVSALAHLVGDGFGEED